MTRQLVGTRNIPEHTRGVLYLQFNDPRSLFIFCAQFVISVEHTSYENDVGCKIRIAYWDCVLGLRINEFKFSERNNK